MAPVNCCVPGCNINVPPQHRFPNPKKDLGRFEEWRNAIQDNQLFNMDVKDIYDRKKVCHSHFESRFFSVGAKRLHLNAVPTLFLPPILTGGDKTGRMIGATEPSVSKEQNNFEKNIEVYLEIAELFNDLALGTPSKTMEFTYIGGAESHEFPLPATTSTKNIGLTPSTCAVTIESPPKMLKAAGINVRKDMTPRKNRLYSMVKKMSWKLKRTSISKDSFRKRLLDAEKFAKEKGLEENLNTLNEIV